MGPDPVLSCSSRRPGCRAFRRPPGPSHTTSASPSWSRGYRLGPDSLTCCSHARSQLEADSVVAVRWLRDDVYRRPLATALDRLALGPGWKCVDVGAGGGDV